MKKGRIFWNSPLKICHAQFPSNSKRESEERPLKGREIEVCSE